MALQEFQDAIRAAGLESPDHIIAGVITAFPGQGKSKGNKAARCLLFPDRQGGWFMDYSTGLFEVWQAKRESPYTEQERQAFKEQCERDRLARERERQDQHQRVAKKALSIWTGAPLADDGNGYCNRKKIQPHGAKQAYSGALIIPIYDESLALVNLQFIQPDGNKRFLKGGRKKGCFWWIGKSTKTILLAEGFSTAASVFEDTGHQTFIAFDAGNMADVARLVRAKRPGADIIIMGDNDENGTGQAAARAAALACFGGYLLPPEPGTDWNDYITGMEALL